MLLQDYTLLTYIVFGYRKDIVDQDILHLDWFFGKIVEL